MKKDIKIGTKAKCQWCGEDIHWDGKRWQHTKDAYRHPALPKGESWKTENQQR